MFAITEETALSIRDEIESVFMRRGFKNVLYSIGVSFTDESARHNSPLGLFQSPARCMLSLMNHDCGSTGAWLTAAQIQDIEEGIQNGKLHVHGNGLPEMPECSPSRR